ncbi:MerR family transcriptional regulator [uncultured Pseudacidovorax sp.]|uniref:MerR family transcriptional regulator n=1 Tax=uncultured Pseudacidovorax sp. TaxID=679313 RepID=UPI0025F2DBD8|nr:MerR family transcriptional regulator [uncultured Pseudacidovorax sp.]
MENSLPPIPVKRYFTIGEVAELCGVKPHVLRYWEQEFTQLRPMKRRGNRRYYQHHEVLMIRRIRDLLYEQGFTISGARNRLQELAQAERERRRRGDLSVDEAESAGTFAEQPFDDDPLLEEAPALMADGARHSAHRVAVDAELVVGSPLPVVSDAYPVALLRRELLEIRELLSFY